MLDEWLACQRSWMYLESIFAAPDLQRQLPAELKMFVGVDKAWKRLMRGVANDPDALKAGTAAGVLDELRAANHTLSITQRRVEDHLETKRVAFPRFAFLSNDELLCPRSASHRGAAPCRATPRASLSTHRGCPAAFARPPPLLGRSATKRCDAREPTTLPHRQPRTVV